MASKFGAILKAACLAKPPKGVPAYVILHDATLAELGEISGLGTKKLEAYGEAVLGVAAG
ncbi:MAG: hypothetical protein BGO74_00170 [Burkholderiales bacterium 68-12]|nr:MAG: hypothetical protein BGO74_00170 [Burkholderiales bacterium 68-12]